MQVSCAFPTTLDSPQNAVIAEGLGYERVWVYDTPQNSPDVWMTLGLIADKTERVGIGPGVLIPSLRHPMVNAAGTAALVAMAPGRVAVSFGTGFSGRRAMGYGAITWAFMEEYIRAFKGLLSGEIIEWEGARMQMLHPDGSASPRPVEVPVLIGALGPKGMKAAHEHGDGLYATLQVPDGAKEFPWVSFLMWGTVLDEGEAVSSERVRLAAGPGWALAYHGAYEFAGPDAVRDIPSGKEWMAVVEKTPEDERHLAVHVQHCVGMNDADQAAWDAGGHAMVEQVTVTGSAEQVRGRADELAEQGVTEIVYQPCGPDVARELDRFIGAVRR